MRGMTPRFPGLFSYWPINKCQMVSRHHLLKFHRMLGISDDLSITRKWKSRLREPICLANSFSTSHGQVRTSPGSRRDEAAFSSSGYTRLSADFDRLRQQVWRKCPRPEDEMLLMNRCRRFKQLTPSWCLWLMSPRCLLNGVIMVLSE